MTLAAPTETDYRAWLAFIWTFLTFAIAILALLKNLDVKDIITIISPFVTLDAVFINAYFKSKE